MNGACKPAPCGHPGEVVIGSYVRCLSGCDGAVPQAVNHEKTEPVARKHDWSLGGMFLYCKVCRVSEMNAKAGVPCPGDPSYQASSDPDKCKHPARYSIKGVTRCAACDERITLSVADWNPPVRLKKPIRIGILSRVHDDDWSPA
jgi:hypothetical protein